MRSLPTQAYTKGTPWCCVRPRGSSYRRAFLSDRGSPSRLEPAAGRPAAPATPGHRASGTARASSAPAAGGRQPLAPGPPQRLWRQKKRHPACSESLPQGGSGLLGVPRLRRKGKPHRGSAIAQGLHGAREAQRRPERQRPPRAVPVAQPLAARRHRPTAARARGGQGPRRSPARLFPPPCPQFRRRAARCAQEPWAPGVLALRWELHRAAATAAMVSAAGGDAGCPGKGPLPCPGRRRAGGRGARGGRAARGCAEGHPVSSCGLIYVVYICVGA